MTAEETINDVAARLGITMRSEFVPWSLSRSAGEKGPSLNWKVTILKDNREVLRTDYRAGQGHCPSYKQGDNSVDRSQAVKLECERGKPCRITPNGAYSQVGKPTLEPKFADVLHSLCIDSEAIDYGSFEEWADMLGDDPDSRKAEAMYRACLEIGLKLRNALGDDGLRQLREACQDY